MSRRRCRSLYPTLIVRGKQERALRGSREEEEEDEEEQVQRDRVPSAGSWRMKMRMRTRPRRAAAHTQGHVHATRVGAGYVGMRRHAGVRAPSHNGAFLYGEVKGQGCLAMSEVDSLRYHRFLPCCLLKRTTELTVS